MATKKKLEPTVRQGIANPDTHLVLHSGALVGIIGHEEAGTRETLYFPASWKCKDGEWRKHTDFRQAPMVYTPEEAMHEVMDRIENNVGQVIQLPRGNELGKLRVL